MTFAVEQKGEPMSLIDREALIAEYDRVHVGAPGGARKLMVDAPEVRPDDAALHESCTDCPLYDHDKHRCPRFNRVIPTTIQEILDTQTQRGKWVKISPAGIYECSKCGKNVMTDDISEYDFCHGCGADMREEDV